MNTALGNCLLMILMVSTVMYGCDFKWDLLDDGDDCLLFIPKDKLPMLLDLLPKEFLSFGMKLRVDGVARSLEEIEWCQSRLVDTAEGWNFVRNPRKVFANALGGSKYFTSVGARKRLVKTIGLGELAICRGVPVLQEYAKLLIRSGGDSNPFALQDSESYYYRFGNELKYLNIGLSDVTDNVITADARLSFAKAWSIPVQKQIFIEHFLAKLCVPFSGDVALKAEIDVPTWSWLDRHAPDRVTYGV